MFKSLFLRFLKRWRLFSEEGINFLKAIILPILGSLRILSSMVSIFTKFFLQSIDFAKTMKNSRRDGHKSVSYVAGLLSNSSPAQNQATNTTHFSLVPQILDLLSGYTWVADFKNDIGFFAAALVFEIWYICPWFGLSCYEVCTIGNKKMSGETLFIFLSLQNLVSFKIIASCINTLLHASLPILEHLLEVLLQ